MKRLPMLALAAIAASAILVGCTGIKARENVQMPVMLAAYTTVILPHIERGIDVELVTGPAKERAMAAALRLRDALQSGDRSRVRELLVDWQRGLRPMFLAGLAARVGAGGLGPIGVGVLRETLRQFDANMTLLVAR